MEHQFQKKPKRLNQINYKQSGAYFITLVSKNFDCIFSKIISDKNENPKLILSDYGKIVYRQIIKMNDLYPFVQAVKFAVMPNHVHILLYIHYDAAKRKSTPANMPLPSYVSALKRWTNRKIGKSVWADGYFDHIVHNMEDYLLIWKFIDDNPKDWLLNKDEYQ